MPKTPEEHRAVWFEALRAEVERRMWESLLKGSVRPQKGPYKRAGLGTPSSGTVWCAKCSQFELDARTDLGRKIGHVRADSSIDIEGGAAEVHPFAPPLWEVRFT